MLEKYIHFSLLWFPSFCFFSTEDNFLHNNNTYHDGQSTRESSLPLLAKIAGGSLLALLCFSGLLWFALRYRRSR